MKKIVKLTENDLMKIVKKVIKENEDMMDSDFRKPKYDKDMESDGDMIRIPREYSGVRMELGTRPTPEDIIDSYNTTVEEGTLLVRYSDGVFYNEKDEKIPVDVILDELNYAINGEEEIDYDNDEEDYDDDDMPSYKTKWREAPDDDM